MTLAAAFKALLLRSLSLALIRLRVGRNLRHNTLHRDLSHYNGIFLLSINWFVFGNDCQNRSTTIILFQDTQIHDRNSFVGTNFLLSSTTMTPWQKHFRTERKHDQQWRRMPIRIRIICNFFVRNEYSVLLQWALSLSLSLRSTLFQILQKLTLTLLHSLLIIEI